MNKQSTVSTREIEHFAKDSPFWWDENGPFAPLHRLNPVRLQYIKNQICTLRGLETMSFKPYRGLSVLDIGCGGGLVCEPMARLGAEVKGIDADSNAIEAAQRHAGESGLSIEYECTTSEDLLKRKKLFDVVLALEIVEHVADVDGFVRNCVDLCRKDGIVIFSTLNRTTKSFLLGKLAAEYVLGWVPKGTHDWKKFIRPSELAAALRHAGADIVHMEGMVFDPAKGQFKLASRDLGVNYFLTAIKR